MQIGRSFRDGFGIGSFALVNTHGMESEEQLPVELSDLFLKKHVIDQENRYGHVPICP